jgi:hypothetical protein
VVLVGFFRPVGLGFRLFGLQLSSTSSSEESGPAFVLPNSSNAAAGRVTAFLNVELFRVMYDQFKGHALPPPPAIERNVVESGVSPKH